MRVTADVVITTKKGRKLTLRTYPLAFGKSVWFKQIVYRQDGYLTGVNLAGVVADGSDDPWWLLTNLRTATAAITRYESRFRIEEWFKDLKHQLRIANQQTKSIKRIRRLLMVAGVAYGFLLLTGKLAQPFKTWYDFLVTGRNKSVSILWMAIQVIKANLAPAFFWRRVWNQALVRAGP
ncbi:MAG: hypothetical protein GF334_04250 [Candidatus Altiarchaeales archaeon]|nr:hypothetical protein [Candidatus Altiarchaeales archaeon]